ncbi:hypothetical protein [Mesorhizobium sp.]|uniref:hypothetical protein n=1 Tax=Mesorhizobium sp. TaxID=1871066 RepID=UPI0025F75B30|nr:hypothetical protein [Mesorhizobium sp.]
MTEAMLIIAPALRDRKAGSAARVRRVSAVMLSAMVEAAFSSNVLIVDRCAERRAGLASCMTWHWPQPG